MKKHFLITVLSALFAANLLAVAEDTAPYRGSGGRISMNVEEADIRSVLRSISEFSGMNIVAGTEVKGPVTVLLHDVPWRAALDNVLLMNDFLGVEENGIIRVTTHKDIALAEKNEPLSTGIYQLKYGRSEKIQTILAKLVSTRGRVQADRRANILIVYDIPRIVNSIDTVIQRLDKPTSQVLIEAKIVEVDATTSREIGVNWSLGNLSNPLTNTRADGSVNLGVGEPSGSFTFGRLENGVNIEARLTAMEENNKAEVLSQPSVLISDNEEAQILSGKKIPINVLDDAGNTVTQFYDVAVKLNVTPHINPNNEVLMQLSPEVSDLSGEATVVGGLIILTSAVNTTLLVKDNETIVIGGVLRTKEGKLERKVPLLHSIPVLGNLFKYSAETKDKTEILIFVTPHIVPSSMATK